MKQLGVLLDKYGFALSPVLIALFPLLSFYGANFGELQSEPFPLLTFVLFSLGVAAVAWMSSWMILKDRHKATILAALLLTIFFSFVRLHERLSDIAIKTPIIILGPTKLLVVASLVALWLIWRWMGKRSEQDVGRINIALAYVSLALVASTMVTIIPAYLSKDDKAPNQYSAERAKTGTQEGDKSQPDVYYILLDGYGRADILQQNFKFDNTPFIDALKKRGFYVASKANSNYTHTHFSVPSTFNMKYLDDLSRQMGDESTDRTPLRKLIDHNEVVTTFKALGYKYVQIGSQWGWTERSPSADITIPAKTNSDSRVLGIRLDEFAQVYLQTTALKPWVSATIRDALVAKTLGAYERTEEVSTIDDPTLTFTHIVSPHPPYLFDRHGIIEGQTKLELDNHGFSDTEQYIEQMRFVNKRMLELVDKILAESDQPPIIMIAGDHGPASELNRADLEVTDIAKLNERGVRERMGILSAYYFPDGNYNKLYPSVTLVNSFRVVLSQYFSQKLELLPDRSYFSNNKANEYRMLDVTDIVK
jgi:hypothetical protein